MTPPDPRHPTLARIAPVALLALLLAITAVGTVLAFRRVDARVRDARADAAEAVATAVDRRMQEATELLQGAAALWTARAEVTPAEFDRFLTGQDALERFPGTLAILHARFVDRDAVVAFVRRTDRATAASGRPYPPVRVHPPVGGAGRRLLIVDRLEPVTRQTKAFGLDLLRDPERRPIALRALRGGRPAAGPPLEPLRYRGPGLAVMIMVPVEAPGRGGGARGLVYGAFRMDLLLRGVVGRLPDGVELELFDLGLASAGGGARPRSFRLAGSRSEALLDDESTHVATLAVGGRRWALAYHAPHAAVSRLDRSSPWLVLAAGILLSLLAAALLHAMASGRARAVALAEAMTVELRDREAELQASHAELEHFAYLASHDLQEPLRTITSYAGLLQRRSAGQLDERAQTWLRFISEGAARMSDLIADLLEYSRSGRPDGAVERIALDDAWDTAVANLAEAVARSGATVTRGSLPVVAGRERELVSLLQNLIGNALKYRAEAPPTVHAEAERRDGRWQIRVQDNGIGIDPRFHDQVFGLFQRLHAADEYPGTGMGLAIVRKIAESRGGSVRVESEPGKGSTFIVELPAEDER